MEGGRGRWRGANIQDEDGHGNDSFAEAAGCPAEVGGVVGGLGRESREPDDGEDGVDDQHGVGLGELACAWEARGHHQVDPGRY